MLVYLTGATGFIGAHTVAKLAAEGHRVRLLVRRPERVATALDPHGDVASAIESVVVGDATDDALVRSSIAGCDAVVHAAAVYSLDVAAAEKMRRTNVAAARSVLGAACDLGIDPIIYVSSYVVFLGTGAKVIGPDDPIGDPSGAYAVSKAEAERFVRECQGQGAPITSIYPGTVWGPRDPRGALSDSQRTAYLLLRGRTPFAMRGGIPIVDVRAVAETIAASLEPGRGPRRYLCGGTYTTWNDLTRMMRELSGRRIPQIPTPLALAEATGRLADVMRPLGKRRPPFGFEGPWYLRVSPRTDDAKTKRELDVVHRPVRETLSDQINWMFEEGLVGGSRR